MKRSDLDCERIAQTTVIESFKRSQQRAQSAKLVPDLCDPTVLADQGEPNFLFSLLCLAWKVVGLLTRRIFPGIYGDFRIHICLDLPGFSRTPERIFWPASNVVTIGPNVVNG